MFDTPPTTSSQDSMAGYGAQPADAAVLPCQQANRLWLENQSGKSVSMAVSVGDTTSSVLPQTADTPTLLPNTLPGSTGAIELSVNGTSARLLDSIPSDLIKRPEDVQVGLVVGAPRSSRKPIAQESRGIPVRPGDNQADLSPFLSGGISEGNTDIDMVMVCLANDGPGAITAPGAYQVDGLSNEQLQWMAGSIVSNTVASAGNEAGSLAIYAGRIARADRGQAIAAIRELVLDGRFYVKPIASWGGRSAIIFKGAHRSRSFLTAISYGLRNGKMDYISSYADVMAGQGGSGVARAARSAAKGNFIGFVVAAAFDVHAFFQSEDPEKNWGGLLGKLAVTFVKVWAAGFAGVLIAATVASTLAAAPVILVVGIGVGASIVVGFLLDGIDDWLGVSKAARKIGRGFAGAVERALAAVPSFIEKIETSVDGLIDSWFADFRQNLRRTDPNGYCALFCSNPLDQLDAWMRGFGGGGLGGRW